MGKTKRSSVNKCGFAPLYTTWSIVLLPITNLNKETLGRGGVKIQKTSPIIPAKNYLYSHYLLKWTIGHCQSGLIHTKFGEPNGPWGRGGLSRLGRNWVGLLILLWLDSS